MIVVVEAPRLYNSEGRLGLLWVITRLSHLSEPLTASLRDETPEEVSSDIFESVQHEVKRKDRNMGIQKTTDEREPTDWEILKRWSKSREIRLAVRIIFMLVVVLFAVSVALADAYANSSASDCVTENGPHKTISGS